jgi:hypothetical protein
VRGGIIRIRVGGGVLRSGSYDIILILVRIVIEYFNGDDGRELLLAKDGRRQWGGGIKKLVRRRGVVNVWCTRFGKELYEVVVVIDTDVVVRSSVTSEMEIIVVEVGLGDSEAERTVERTTNCGNGRTEIFIKINVTTEFDLIVGWNVDEIGRGGPRKTNMYATNSTLGVGFAVLLRNNLVRAGESHNDRAPEDTEA